MTDLLTKYSYSPDKEAIARHLDLLASNLEKVVSPEVLKECFSFMDLTTLHNADTTESVARLMNKVNSFKTDFPDYPLPASVCVFSNFASVVKEALVSDDVHVTAVSGCFPTSQSFIEIKVKECELAVKNGADEIDIVVNLSMVKDGCWEDVKNDILAVRNACRGKVLKVIIECCLLTEEEKTMLCDIVSDCGADYIKTSTGFSKGGATHEDVRLMRARCPSSVKVKAAGGISTLEDAEEFLAEGADRLGTSRIVKIAMALEQDGNA